MTELTHMSCTCIHVPHYKWSFDTTSYAYHVTLDQSNRLKSVDKITYYTEKCALIR